MLNFVLGSSLIGVSIEGNVGKVPVEHQRMSAWKDTACMTGGLSTKMRAVESKKPKFKSSDRRFAVNIGTSDSSAVDGE